MKTHWNYFVEYISKTDVRFAHLFHLLIFFRMIFWFFNIWKYQRWLSCSLKINKDIKYVFWLVLEWNSLIAHGETEWDNLLQILKSVYFENFPILADSSTFLRMKLALGTLALKISPLFFFVDVKVIVFTNFMNNCLWINVYEK